MEERCKLLGVFPEVEVEVDAELVGADFDDALFTPVYVLTSNPSLPQFPPKKEHKRIPNTKIIKRNKASDLFIDVI